MHTHSDTKTVHPDIKGRITLGKLAKGVSSFHVSVDGEGRIILEPYVEIPAREQWIFKNKTAMKQLRKGLDDAAKGKLRPRGDFGQYTD